MTEGLFNHQSPDVDDLISKLTSRASASPSLSRCLGCPAPRPSAPATLLSRTHTTWVAAVPAAKPHGAPPRLLDDLGNRHPARRRQQCPGWRRCLRHSRMEPRPAGRDRPLSPRTTAFGKRQRHAHRPDLDVAAARLAWISWCSVPHLIEERWDRGK